MIAERCSPIELVPLKFRTYYVNYKKTSASGWRAEGWLLSAQRQAESGKSPLRLRPDQ
jgi:hypothetical protein